MNCPYCNQPADLTTGHKVYPLRPDLASLKLWACLPCEAWVGTHKNSPTNEPLGRLANAELRRAKMAAHVAFDPLWQGGYMHRKDAYKLLSKKMGLTAGQTHIGMFDVNQCKAVVLICTPLLAAQRRGFMVYA